MLVKILRFSIANRWTVVLLTLLAAGAGLYSFQVLPIDAVPDITNRQVQVNVTYPALSPLEIEQQVTFPTENALTGIPGLVATRSISRNGFSQTTAIFEDDTDIYFARQQVAERLVEAREHLPPGADPIMGPVATGLGEIYMYTVEFDRAAPPATSGQPGWQPDGAYLTPNGQRLTSELELGAFLREVQEWIIAPQLKAVKDVAAVDAIGGYMKQYHVQPEPLKLVSYGLTFADVIDALERNNLSTGAGYIEHKGEAYVVRATGRIANIRQIEDIAIGVRNGVPLRIRDVVGPNGVGVGRELRTGSASRNGAEAVVGTVIMLAGANSRTVAAAVDQAMGNIRRSLPPGVRVETVLNRTELVDATIHTVRTNLFEGAILVIVVLLALLGNLRAALICASAIPLSMLLAATGMVRCSISGNLMSLGAIDFGLIVDGAVIIVENCLRRLAHRQQRLGRALTRKERLKEVLSASREMARPSLFGQAIIITVYLPVLALTGIEGRLFHPMSLTVIFALLAALVLSLTFVPAAVAILMRGKVSERESWLIRACKSLYEPVLRVALRWRWLVAVLAVAAFTGSALLFTRMGQEFVPTLDEGNIAMHAVRIPGTALSQSTAMQLHLERLLIRIPEVSVVFSKTGTAEVAMDPMPPHVSDTFIMLKPESAWRDAAALQAAIEELEPASHAMEHHDDSHGHGLPRPSGGAAGRKHLLLQLIERTVQQAPGNNYEFSQPIQMRFNELIAGVRGDVAVKVYGDNFDDMNRTATRILETLREIPGATDLKLEQTRGLPMVTIDIDRAAVARYGLDLAAVHDVIEAAIGGRQVGLVFEGDRRFDLVVRLPDAQRANPEAIRDLPIPLPTDAEHLSEPPLTAGRHAGEFVPPGPRFVALGQVANVDLTEGANQVTRENGKRVVVVQCNVRGRDLNSFVAEARERTRDVPLPAGGWLDWGGQYENLLAAKSRLQVVVPVCFMLIFVLLMGMFRSAVHALLVFSAVPLGLTGGVLALWVRGMPFSISAAVGFIALSGVAVLNGLVMVSFINSLRRKGMSVDAAIHQGSLARLRPVLMTALVASLGFVPMALATGAGAEVQRPLATVVIGGLITSTLLTLVVLPALYRIVTRSAGQESGAPA